jgi:hypothetical protein
MRDRTFFAITLLGFVALLALLAHGQTRVAPAQIQAPRFVAMACVAPGTANSNCAGLFYIDAITPTGTEIKIIGAAPTAPIDPAAWSLVP